MTDEERAREDKQLRYIEYLVKENKDLQHRLDVAQGFLDRDVEYIEMCKAVKENAELKAQIEVLQLQVKFKNDLTEIYTTQIENMKCCENCKYNSVDYPNLGFCVNCKGCNKWEMVE